MASDEHLRTALMDALDDLDPRVDAELERTLARATRRRATRLSAYGVGLVAAVLVSLMVGQHWRTTAEPQPVDDPPPARAQVLTPERGTFLEPQALEPGPWSVVFQGAGANAPFLQVDVPPGWSQDDDMVLTTGVGNARDTLRIELAGDLETTWPDPCRKEGRRAAPTAVEVATALARTKRLGTGTAQPVTLDGRAGYFVRLEASDGRDPGTDPDPQTCPDGLLRIYQNAGWPKGYSEPGWTDLIWVFDLAGRTVLIDACYGPEATEDEIQELVRMVEGSSFVDP